MSNIPVKIVCPLGATCESVKDGEIHRCAWYAHVRGTNKNTGEELDEWACSMNWMPYLLIENSDMQRQTAANITVFREEMMQANEASRQVLLATWANPAVLPHP